MPVSVTNTLGLLRLIKDSEGRNRGPTRELIETLDPDGLHLVSHRILHNDCEYRCLWLIKTRGQVYPVQIWMDNGFAVFHNSVMDVDEDHVGDIS